MQSEKAGFHRVPEDAPGTLYALLWGGGAVTAVHPHQVPLVMLWSGQNGGNRRVWSCVRM